MEETEMTEEIPEPTQRRRALVSEVQSRVENAKAYHNKAFKQMRSDMKAAYNGFKDSEWDDHRYVANILQRHVQQRTAALYAKNPKPVARRRERLEYQMWDGEEETLSNAYAMVAGAQQTGMEPPPDAIAMIQDYEGVQQNRKMLDKVAKTLEILFNYYMAEQEPSFKSNMKALVRRVITCGVGFVKVGYQRDMDRSPEVSAKISDVQAQIDMIRRIAGEAAEGEVSDDDAQMEELMLSMNALMEEPMVLIREGLIFDFPEVDSIIVDPQCRQMRGFVGAKWIAHEMYLTPNEIKEIYDVDIKDDYLTYDLRGRKNDPDNTYQQAFQNPHYDPSKNIDNSKSLALVWEVYDRQAGLMYVVCDGHKDFLKEPTAPPVKTETFWPFHALVFNECETKDILYPPSDVKLLLPMQHEYNRARQMLREHRRANRPKYAAPAGMLEEQDKAKLQSHPANALIELQALATGQKVNDVIQPVGMIGIDPNLYEVSTIFDDVQLVAGQQEANYGSMSKGTATETSIAESSRMSALGAQVDELDSFMSDICRSAGQVLLTEMSMEQVQRVVGPGAVWPELSREQIMAEVFLEIEAGSTGKPNKAQELQNIERIIPFLIQIPGIDPVFLGKELLKRLDDKLDLAEAIAEQIPSIVAMNQMQGMQAQAGDSGSPSQQGGQGAMNAPRPGGSGGSLPPMGSNRG